MAKNLVVVIPTSKRSDLLSRTLSSLTKCRLPAIYRKTIVVENGPQKVAGSICNKLNDKLNIQYIHIPTANKSLALNAVLETIEGSLIVFFDDDVRMDPGILEAYAAAAKEADSGEFYGGPFQVDYVKPPPAWMMEILPKAAVGWSLGDKPKRIRKGQAFLGFNWAAFSTDLKRLNGFSVDHGPGSKTRSVGQETEMEGRLMDSGIIGYYVPKAMVWHYVPPERCSIKFASSQAYRWGIQGGLRYQGSLTPIVRDCMKFGLKTLFKFGNPNPGKFYRPYMGFRYNSGIIKGRLMRAAGK